jgi:methionyl-tRNA formyltransferase
VKVLYAGTAPFAVLVLRRLMLSGHPVVGCLTTPDRPRGRHGSPQPSPLKEEAISTGLPVVQPESLRSAEALDELLSLAPDLLVACAYGMIVPAALLDRLDALVVHPSAVPRWRGAAPVERALMAGETELAVTTMKMTEGVDEGPVADLRAVTVPRDCDAGGAYELLAGPAAEGLVDALDQVASGTVVWRPQVGEPTYAEKLGEADRIIDWARPAQAIADQVRALSPSIGAVAELGGRRVLIWAARVLPEAAPAAPDKLVLPCGSGCLDVLEVQEAGRRRMTTAEYLRGAGRRLVDR